MLLFVVAVVVSLAFSFVCSLCEAAVLSVSHAHIERLAQTGSRAGLLLHCGTETSWILPGILAAPWWRVI